MQEEYNYLSVLENSNKLKKIIEQKSFNNDNVKEFFNIIKSLNYAWKGLAKNIIIDRLLYIYQNVEKSRDYDNLFYMDLLEEAVKRLDIYLEKMEMGIKDSNFFLYDSWSGTKKIIIDERLIIDVVRKNINPTLSNNEVFLLLSNLINNNADTIFEKNIINSIHKIFCDVLGKTLDKQEFLIIFKQFLERKIQIINEQNENNLKHGK
ncbi:MAG: hypothetical protein J6D28_05460 [Bacilli bacterium]|nr:hypothetical protein [Bacilli bacterium]